MPRPPSTAVSGTSAPKARKLSGGFQGRSSSELRRRSRITETWAIVNESIAPNEYIVARKSVWPGIRVIVAIAGEDEDRDVGGAVAGMDLAQALGQLAVLAHRVGEPGDADQAGVGRDQQDHRGEDADVEAQRVGQAGAEAEVLDDAEDRVVGELGAELGRVLAGGVLGDRHRRERDDRDQQVEAEHRDDGEADAARDRPRRRPAPPRPCWRSSRSRCRRSSRPRSRARSRSRSGRRRGGRCRSGSRG